MKYFKVLLLFVTSVVFFTGCTPSEQTTVKPPGEMKYVSTNTYSPVFNIPHIYKFLSELDGEVKSDKKGLVAEVSFVAPPGKEFEIIEEIEESGYTILKVRPVDSEKIYYIDSRFIEQSKSEYSQKGKLSGEEIIRNLKAMEGYPYEYGGSIANGVYKFESMYEINGLKEKWKPKGLDCSGLIYQATNGLTPRTSTAITEFGEGLDIEDKELDEIIEMVEPLDIIGYPGHVLIVIDKNRVMESSPKKGVRILQLETRLEQLMKERNPVNSVKGEDKNKIFVIRRWYK